MNRAALVHVHIAVVLLFAGVLLLAACNGGEFSGPAPVTYTIGGTVLGFSGMGLVLQDNGGDNLMLTPGATTFTFATPIASGATFNVTVLSQPSSPSQTCGVTAGGGGIVASANVTSVRVTCIGSPGFVLTGSMPVGLAFQTATLLNNEKVLLVGYYNGSSAPSIPSSSNVAEVYDPATGTFTAMEIMATGIGNYTATLLNNGEVLITGGQNAIGDSAGAELYDPANGSFTATGSMTTAREQHTATLLNDGKVLIAGGVDNSPSPLASAELYDPATGAFTATGNMITAREDQTATLLNNGKVLITGGQNATTYAFASAELYDATTGTFTPTGNMTTAREDQTATLLNDGKVLVAGGYGAVGLSLASAELYDPTTGTFTPTGNMNSPRAFHAATLLNNGNVLIAGGDDIGASSSSTLASAELYDLAAGAFTLTGSMTAARGNPVTATLLSVGGVLVAGGDGLSAELYLPETLTPTGLVSISVTPTTPALSVGSTQQFVATGNFSDGSMQNIQSVTWSSSNQGVGTITNDANDHGVALALAAGQSTITASAGSISGSTVLTVQ